MFEGAPLINGGDLRHQSFCILLDLFNAIFCTVARFLQDLSEMLGSAFDTISR